MSFNFKNALFVNIVVTFFVSSLIFMLGDNQ